jgi:hypothetical protein
MKTYGGVDAKIHVFLTSALDGDKPRPLYPMDIVPGTQNRSERRGEDSNTDPSAVQPVYQLSYPGSY